MHGQIATTIGGTVIVGGQFLPTLQDTIHLSSLPGLFRQSRATTFGNQSQMDTRDKRGYDDECCAVWSLSLSGSNFRSVQRLPVVVISLVAAVVCLSQRPAHAACTKWQAEVVWGVGTDEQRHSGVGGNKQAALGNARTACLNTAASDTAKDVCRSATPIRDKYLCTDGKCVHVDIEDGLGWRRDQGWSRRAFCIDRGFDGVIRDAADDQTGVCYKGAC